MWTHLHVRLADVDAHGGRNAHRELFLRRAVVVALVTRATVHNVQAMRIGVEPNGRDAITIFAAVSSGG